MKDSSAKCSLIFLLFCPACMCIVSGLQCTSEPSHACNESLLRSFRLQEQQQ
jgi:hypothetical protein